MSTLFVDYRIQSNANNQIGMTVSTDALLTTLRSACGPNNKNESILANTEVIMRRVAITLFDFAHADNLPQVS